MRHAPTRTQATLAAAGVASGAAFAQRDAAPQLDTRVARGVPVGHIYYNVATGERVITPYEQGPRSSSEALWLNNNADPCGTGMSVGVIDDPDLNGDGFGDFTGEDCLAGTFPCEGAWTLFWGDIEYNSVIDCVVLAYGINAPDLDADSDSMGDGIVGYDMYLTFSDNDNGFAQDFPGHSGRSCILDLAVPSVAGVAGALPAGQLAIFMVTLDFGSAAPSLIFELSDSDGVDDAGTGISGASLYGPGNGFPNPSGIDIDSDGLGDFSYALRFDQSTLGVSGDPGLSRGANGFVTAARKLGNPGDLPPDPADATGIFDARDVYEAGPQCTASSTGNPAYLGTFFYGGFTCEPGAEIPYSSAYLELYGPQRIDEGCDIVIGGCNSADLAEPGGVLDFNDVLEFLGGFANQEFCADQAPPEGTWDFADVLAFLTAFAEGCP